MENKKETTALQAFKNGLLKTYGKTSNMVQDVDNIVYERFSSGNLKLDIELKGGYVKGSHVEMYGWEGSGKTTTCIEAAREFQTKYPDEVILWVDMEKVFEKEYFEYIGVDTNPDKFILVRPGTGEDAFSVMIDFAKNFQGGFIAVDSVALLLPSKEDEGDMGNAQMGSHARLMSQGMRKIFPHTSKNGTTVFWINQLRMKIGVMFGSPETTTGGNALAFYARTRMNISRVKGNHKEEAAGMNIKLDKATYGNEKAKVETHLLLTGGFHKSADLIELGVESGVIDKGGSWYSYGDMKIGQGLASVSQLFEDNTEFAEEVENKVREHFGI